MILNILFLIVGFVILIKGADMFVDGASSVAGRFHVSKMLIGLTIVAFGTSAPELAVSISSLLSGSGDIVVGNVIGSNILNILLILGLCAVIHSLSVKNETVRKELPIAALITAAFTALMCDRLLDGADNAFTRSDGIVILLFFAVFLYYLIRTVQRKRESDKLEAASATNKRDKARPKEAEIEEYMKMPKAVLFTIVGMVGIVGGSELVVNGASGVAAGLGVSERLVALTVVALGTSLPELVTSVLATRKGEYEIAIGNVVGSNIFNIGMVLGLPVAIFGTIPNITFNYIDLVVLLVSAILLYIFARNDKKITRVEGAIFLCIFVAYYTYVIYSGITG